MAKLGELAAQFGCELIGDPTVEVSSVSTLSDAVPGSISFLANPAYKDQLQSTSASAVVVAADDADACPTAALVSDDPYLTYARIASVLRQYQAVDVETRNRPGAFLMVSVLADQKLRAAIFWRAIWWTAAK